MIGIPRRWTEAASAKTPDNPVSLAEATRVWVRIGWLSFGGPAGQIALMHRELVEQRRWISDARLLHAATGPGSATARDLYRLADAPHRRRRDRRHFVCAAWGHRDRRIELVVRHLPAATRSDRDLLRPESCCIGGRSRGGPTRRAASAEESRDDRDCSRCLRGTVFLQSSIPVGHPERGFDRHRRPALATDELSGGCIDCGTCPKRLFDRSTDGPG